MKCSIGEKLVKLIWEEWYSFNLLCKCWRDGNRHNHIQAVQHSIIKM